VLREPDGEAGDPYLDRADHVLWIIGYQFLLGLDPLEVPFPCVWISVILDRYRYVLDEISAALLRRQVEPGTGDQEHRIDGLDPFAFDGQLQRSVGGIRGVRLQHVPVGHPEVVDYVVLEISVASVREPVRLDPHDHGAVVEVNVIVFHVPLDESR